jgi:hypothetical protein
MTGTPSGELSDEELDEIVRGQDDDEPNEAPEPASTGPAADEASDTPTDAAPDNASPGDATPATDVAAQPATAASAPPAPVAGKPFQFNATGSVHTLAGALELPDGSVVIPKEAQPEFRRVLASQRALETTFKQTKREFDRQLTAARSQRTAKDVEADAVVQLFSDIQKMSPEERWNYFVEFDQKVPELRNDIRQKQLDEREKAIEEAKRGPQLSPEEQQEKTASLAVSELNTEFQEIEKNPQFKSLTQQQKRAVYDKWVKKADRLVRKATADDPQRGIKAGDELFDPADLYEDLSFAVAMATPVTVPSQAAKQNAARNADQTTTTIPPTVRHRQPVGQPRDTNGQFKNRDDWRKDFKESDLDDDE